MFYINTVAVSSYDEPCSLDIQCSNVSGAICASKQVEKAAAAGESLEVESKVCTCGEDDYYKSGKCLRKRCKTSVLCAESLERYMD